MEEIYTTDNCYIELELDVECLKRLKLEFVTTHYVRDIILKQLKLPIDDVKNYQKIIRIVVKKSSKNSKKK